MIRFKWDWVYLSVQACVKCVSEKKYEVKTCSKQYFHVRTFVSVVTIQTPAKANLFTQRQCESNFAWKIILITLKGYSIITNLVKYRKSWLKLNFPRLYSWMYSSWACSYRKDLSRILKNSEIKPCDFWFYFVLLTHRHKIVQNWGHLSEPVVSISAAQLYVI